MIAKRAPLRPLAGAARPGRRRRGAQPRGPARLAGGDRPADPRRLRADRDRPAHRHAAGGDAAPGLDGPPAAGRRAAGRRRRARRSTRPPTPRSSCGYLGEHGRRRAAVAHRRPRHARRGRLPVLRGPHRRRDHLGRLPDRPVRGRVGARRAPGGRRGGGRRRARRRARRVVRAVVVLRDGPRARPTRSPASCRTTSRRQTAPYKYPRIVDFAAELPKTASGKVRRAALRGG